MESIGYCWGCREQNACIERTPYDKNATIGQAAPLRLWSRHLFLSFQIFVRVVLIMNSNNKSLSALAAVVMATLVLTTTSANAVQIYLDDFSGSGAADLHGTTPDITTGGNTWVASTGSTDYKADGSFSTTTEGSMSLAFTPVDGTVYTLDATFENLSGSHWAQFGFGNGQEPNWAGRAWNLLRTAEDGNPHSAYADGWVSGVAWSDLGTLRYDDDLDVRIELDTTGGTGNWTATYFAKAGNVGTYTEVRAATTLTDETIDSVGVDVFNSGRGGKLSSFSLSDSGPAALLTLQVDTLTGMATILGDPSEDIDFNFYEITSAGDSLDSAGWNSIEDQDDVGGGFPAANPAGSGNGWEQSGSIGTHALAEGYLLGSSTFGAGESIDLGAIYDGGEQDWQFSYRTADGSVEEGVVDFTTSAFDPADLNQDGFVDGLDLGIQLINWGQDVTPDQGELNGAPPVNGLDLGLLLIAWNPKPLSAAAVPEPASFTLVLASLCLAMGRRRIAAR
jgi:hypothetical protein